MLYPETEAKVNETISLLCDEIKTKLQGSSEASKTYLPSLIQSTSDLIKASR